MLLLSPDFALLENSLAPAPRTPGTADLPLSLLLAPTSIIVTKWVIARADASWAFTAALVMVGASIAALSCGTADAPDDETLGCGLDEDVSDDGGYAAAVAEFEASVEYVVAVAEEERVRRVAASPADVVPVSPLAMRIKQELPRDLVSLEAARGDGHSLYLNGRFKKPGPQAPKYGERLYQVGLGLVGAASAYGLGTHPAWGRAYAFAAARVTPELYCVVCLLPVVFIAGYHAGGAQQGDIYAALAHDQKVEEWEKLSTVKYDQPGVVRSTLKPAGLRRSNSRTGLTRSNSGSNLRRTNSRGNMAPGRPARRRVAAAA